MASPLAEATFTVPSSEMSILAPVFHDLAITLPPVPITSRILSVGIEKPRCGAPPSSARAEVNAFAIAKDMQAAFSLVERRCISR